MRTPLRSTMKTKNYPATMRAWTFSTAGIPEQILSLNSSFPTPPGPKGIEVLVRVSHVALSSPGKNLMKGVPSALRRNAIPEVDFSGGVVAVGADVPEKFALGTAVFGTVSKYGSIISGHGSLAEYILINAGCIAIKPSDVSFAEASCLSVLGQVAMEMIRRAHVKQDRILVNGGSGVVGTAAVQIAKDLGAYVVVICSGTKADIVKSLGVDEVINYRQVTSVPNAVTNAFGAHPFDSILDVVGSQDLFKESPKYLKRSGAFVNVGDGDGETGQLTVLLRALKNILQPSFLGGVPRKFITFSAPLSGRNAEHLAKLAELGKLRVFIDSVFSFEDVQKAYKHDSSRETRGRTVIAIGNFDRTNELAM